MKQIAQEIYAPSWIKESVVELPEREKVCSLYFHQARYALFQLLKLAKPSHILLPEFICADVVEVLKQLEVEPVFYHVNKQLDVEIESLPNSTQAPLLLWVNYFGLPSNFTRVANYCQEHHIEIIEDNAQSFYCFQGAEGEPRELLGDYRLQSFRKSLPLATGASLEAKEGSKYFSELMKIKQAHSETLQLALSKVPFRRLLKVMPLAFLRGLLQLKRSIGQQPPENIEDLEKTMSCYSKVYLPAIDAVKMRQIRRQAYEGLKTYLSKRYDEINFLGQYTDSCAPSAVAISVDPSEQAKIIQDLNSMHLDIVRWPKFYDEELVDKQRFYSHVFMIPLNW